MTASPPEPTPIRGQAVLRDYPLRLWAAQQEHMQALLREFQLLLVGDQQSTDHTAPRRLLELADMFTARFGPLIEQIHAERQSAYDRGQDRMDSHVPMPEGTPELLQQVNAVLAAVDEYCARGDLLVLPRSPELRALSEWTTREITAQYDGAAPTPWPGTVLTR
ncbi:MAG: hypothetical protein ACLGIG_04595 [Actinomycetes bacterium]